MWFRVTNKIKKINLEKAVSKPEDLFNYTLNDDAMVLTFLKLHHKLLEDDNHRSY